MIDDAAAAVCECVKFQCHVIEDEMIPNDVNPRNATRASGTSWRDAPCERRRAALTAHAERSLDLPVDALFARLPPIARTDGRAGLQDRPASEQLSARRSHRTIRQARHSEYRHERHSEHRTPSVENPACGESAYALTHCTSTLPDPYKQSAAWRHHRASRSVSRRRCRLSDHSLGNYTCLAALRSARGSWNATSL